MMMGRDGEGLGKTSLPNCGAYEVSVSSGDASECLMTLANL